MAPRAALACTRRQAAILAAGLGLPGLARSQPSWPDRPVRLVLPFGAGGAVDTLSRTVAQAFPPHANGQSLVVENRGGAGGTIAGAVVAQARPDGSVLMMGDLGANAIGRALQPGIPYDPVTAFTPVCHLVNLPLVLVVPAASEAKDLAGFVALARRRGDMTYAHPGIGYAGQLGQELMNRELGIRMIPVPYRSGAEVARSLVAAETESGLQTVSTALPFIREGRLRALGVASKAPVALLPGVPPIAEVLPGFDVTVWHGILGPAGLPPEIVAAANRAFNAVMAEPAVREAAQRNQAADVVGGTPEQFGALIQAEIARWTPLIRSLGLRAE